MASPPRETWSCFMAAWRRIESWTSRPGDCEGTAGHIPTVSLAETGAECAHPEIAVDPLACRMLALHLGTAELTAVEMATLGEMKRLCAACESRRQCVDDLGDELADPAWQNWRDYCPNATTLSMLNTLRGCRQRTQSEDGNDG